MTREEAIHELSTIFGFGFYNERVDEALNMAIKALEKEQERGKWILESREIYGGKWIPLNAIGGEPEDNGEYLLQLSDGFITSTYYDGKDWELWADAGEPVAWMPLPEPYKESGK